MKLTLRHKTLELLMIFLFVSVFSYHFGYLNGMLNSFITDCHGESKTNGKSASPDYLGKVTSFRSASSLYEYNADHKCRVINYDRLPPDDFPCVKLKVDNTPYICVYNQTEDDQFVSHSIITRGTWEEDFVNMSVAMLKADPELAFIDIGSNIGQFSLVAASMGRKVVAVDELKRHTLMLGRAVVMNDYQHLVRIVHNALSHTYRNIYLVAFQGNPGMTRMKTAKYASMPVAEEVPTILMDDLVNVVDFRRAIMKIDIEGQEVAALLHSVQLFNKVDIPVIIMEWWGGSENLYQTGQERAMVRILITFLKTQGYKLYGRKLRTLDMNKWRQWPMEIIWKK